MAKKKASKAAKSGKADNAATTADGAPDPNNTDTTTPGSGIGSTISNAIGSVTSPFGDWMNSIEADVMNIINQSFNTLFFGLCVALGAFGMAWGIYLLFKDTAPVQGAKSVVKSAAVVAAL